MAGPRGSVPLVSVSVSRAVPRLRLVEAPEELPCGNDGPAEAEMTSDAVGDRGRGLAVGAEAETTSEKVARRAEELEDPGVSEAAPKEVAGTEADVEGP